MDFLSTFRIGSLLVIALVYMLFDLFNNRNVPSIFAYATVAFGALMTIAYYPNLQVMGISALIALIICGLGYFLYRTGQIGAADVTEMAAISLILPIQPVAYLAADPQFGLPFILSVFLAAGVFALLMIPLYYMPRAGLLKRGLGKMVKNRDIFKGVVLGAAYAAFLVFTAYYFPLSTIGVIAVVVVMACSIATAVFERPITDSMVKYLPISQLEEGDIIAFNLMNAKDISAMRRRVKSFDRLATIELIKKLKASKVRSKLPVYRSAMPLALPLFIGVVASLLLGNVILLVI